MLVQGQKNGTLIPVMLLPCIQFLFLLVISILYVFVWIENKKQGFNLTCITYLREQYKFKEGK